MNLKYVFTNETLQHDGRILHRIKALKSFGNVNKNDLGGWIEKEDNLSQEGDCWIADNAKVYDKAYVYDNAQLYDNAIICGEAKIYNDAKLHDYARVEDEAYIYGNADISGEALIYGKAKVDYKVIYNEEINI